MQRIFSCSRILSAIVIEVGADADGVAGSRVTNKVVNDSNCTNKIVGADVRPECEAVLLHWRLIPFPSLQQGSQLLGMANKRSNRRMETMGRVEQ